MKYKIVRMLPFAIIGTMLAAGCAAQTVAEKAPIVTEASEDLSEEMDMEGAVEILLDDSSITANSDKVTISGSTITITKEGIYSFSGALSDGNIVVNADKEDTVQIVLNGVEITSRSYAPIYVAQADQVLITLAEGTTNTLTNGGSFTQVDDNEVDAVIFSKDDLTLKGTGTLEITSPAGEGITGKDKVSILDGSYEITSSGTAIRAKDSVAIENGSFSITTDTDGIHAENKDDDSRGDIYIANGTFNIHAQDDGIHGTTSLVIGGGTYDITAAEGFEATTVTINDGHISINAFDDGINAAKKSSSYSPKVEINGGDITIVMGDGDTDGVDANGDIFINGGTINVTGNSTFDYDGEGTINGGTVIVNGEEITTLPNQMMGGHGGMRQNDGMKQNGGMRPNGDMKQNSGMRPDNGMKPTGDMREPKDEMKAPQDGTSETERIENEESESSSELF